MVRQDGSPGTRSNINPEAMPTAATCTTIPSTRVLRATVGASGTGGNNPPSASRNRDPPTAGQGLGMTGTPCLKRLAGGVIFIRLSHAFDGTRTTNAPGESPAPPRTPVSVPLQPRANSLLARLPAAG